MGYDSISKPMHIQQVINDYVLPGVGAVKAYMDTQKVERYLDLVQRGPANRPQGNPIEVWFIGQSGLDAGEYIGVALLDCRLGVSQHYLHNCYADEEQRLNSYIQPGWGWKIMDIGMGPYFYGCPKEFLLRVKPRTGSKSEMKWRKEWMRLNQKMSIRDAERVLRG